jgi:hypothetical protein
MLHDAQEPKITKGLRKERVKKLEGVTKKEQKRKGEKNK